MSNRNNIMIKEKFNFLQMIILMFVFFISGTACEETPQESSSTISTETTIAESSPVMLLEESTETTTSTMETTATSHTTTVTAMTTESETSMVTTVTDEETAEKQLLEALCLEIYGNHPYCANYYYYYRWEEEAEEHLNYIIHNAEPFSENALGSITSEEDAKEKGKAVFIEWMGQEFIDELESDYDDVDGKHLKLERENPPYSMTYYEEYDAWVVVAILRSGLLEDGRALVHTGNSPYVILRGADGKVLAIS